MNNTKRIAAALSLSALLVTGAATGASANATWTQVPAGNTWTNATWTSVTTGNTWTGLATGNTWTGNTWTKADLAPAEAPSFLDRVIAWLKSL